MPICKNCNVDKIQTEFPFRNDRSKRYRPYCNTCANDIARSRYAVHKRDQPFKLKTTRAKSRAQNLKVPFDLDEEYLKQLWTGICPVFNKEIRLNEVDRSDEYAAELDRFIPDKGYVKGNVHFLSRRANRLKNNVTSHELTQLLAWMKQHEDK